MSQPRSDDEDPRTLRDLPKKLGLAICATVLGYLMVANAFWLWNQKLSPTRLSSPEEIRAYHDGGLSFGLYQFHPTRQTTLRPNRRGERHGMDGLWMQTDERGLAYLPPDKGDRSWLVLGDSVAFGSWLPYESSFPGMLKKLTGDRVFSGATESYSLRQTHDLFLEVGGEWDQIVYVWVPNDFYQWAFRETPGDFFPRAGLKRPLDLLDLRDVYLRFTDRLENPPDGVTYDESLAWNPRRYDEHLGLIEEMNRAGNLTVVLTYVRPQLASGRFEPQQWMRTALEERGIHTIDSLEAYRGEMFIRKRDNVHFSEKASIRWSTFVVNELMNR